MNAIKGRARDPPLTHREAMDITSSVLSKNGVSHNVNLSAFDPYQTKHAMEKTKKLEEKVGVETSLSHQCNMSYMAF